MAQFDLSITLEYELVMESHQIPLVQTINEWISQGWQPLGGPFVYEGNLCQAMVKEKPGRPRAFYVPDPNHPGEHKIVINSSSAQSGSLE